MALSRQDQHRVDLLKKASAHLRNTGAPTELADSVDFVLTDEGARFVSRLRWKDLEQESPNLAVRMPRALRDEIKTTVQQKGTSITTEAAAALNAFLADEYTPLRPVRGEHEGPVANLNIRVNADLRRRVDEYGQKLLADGELDWAPITSQVLRSWLIDNFTTLSDPE
ncbi:hypothetical protein OG402_41325 [Streptomyces anulatus]|uniref:hypothetical protein n=1 Tax=Streptomyces anulatus TaxID=1892 RepID=UPI0022561456|nr:hypothetical protein [Streptomyces anulatus]MCX4606872.1 hypothetical protein [Streptomyces anulatus]